MDAVGIDFVEAASAASDQVVSVVSSLPDPASSISGAYSLASSDSPDVIYTAVEYDGLYPFFAYVIFGLACICGLLAGKSLNWFKW